MPEQTKSYRITTKRPIGGIMRKPGDIVALTERAYQAESGWGGIEPVEADAAPSKAQPTVTVDPEEVEGPATDAGIAVDAAAPGKKRK